MKVTITQDTPWSRALDAAKRTIGKEATGKEPSDSWKRKMIIAEHSPIKLVEYTIRFQDLRQWVGVHLVRHAWMLPFIHSQRADRREGITDRDALPQGALNDQDFVVNAQTIVNISRKRLCGKASKETREAWQAVKEEMEKQDPVMASCMVPNCIYCGFCRELEPCGYTETVAFQKALEKYRQPHH